MAKRLLGCFLAHNTIKEETNGQIADVGDYIGPDDKGAHSYKGRHTPRMDPLYNAGGFAYIFQLHGHNYCFNVVTQKTGIPQAVLIRGLKPIQGLDFMVKRQNIDISQDLRSKFKNLTNGPSKLCPAMDIDTSLNRIYLCGDELFITSGMNFKDAEMLSAPRVNIDYAEEYKDKEWRFFLRDNEFVIRYPKHDIQ